MLFPLHFEKGKSFNILPSQELKQFTGAIRVHTIDLQIKRVLFLSGFTNLGDNIMVLLTICYKKIKISKWIIV